MQTLMTDIRYALRQLRRSPGFAITAVLTLALGIGVTVTVASLVQQVLLSPLPYPHPEQLVGTAFYWPQAQASAQTTGAAADFLLHNARSYSSMAVTDGGTSAANLVSSGGSPESVQVFAVSRDYFKTLGVQPMLGRSFNAAEDHAGGAKSIVLSYEFWQRAFGGDPSIIGRTAHLNGEGVSIIGVMPASFHDQTDNAEGTGLAAPEGWLPLQLSPQDPGYQGHNYRMFARLRPGVAIAGAQAEAALLQPALYAANPFFKHFVVMHLTPTLQISSYAKVVSGDIRSSLLVMACAATSVLLLTCLNLAGFNVSRALQRVPEFSLRAALGASRLRLVRLALFEVLLYAAAGSAGAVLVSRMLLPFLLQTSPVPIPQLNNAAGMGSIAALAGGTGLLCAIFFGAPLGWFAVRLQQFSGQRTATAGNRHAHLGRAIVITQVGLALVLLSVCTLLLGTFLNLRSQPIGLNPQRLTVFQTNLKGDTYATNRPTVQFANKVLDSLRSAPGVHSIAAVNGLPFDRGLNDGAEPTGNSNLQVTAEVRATTPGYLSILGVPILQGRDFLESDAAGGKHVAVINALAARHWWPNQSPLGHSIHTLGADWTVIGVAPDTQEKSLAALPRITIYTPLADLNDESMKAVNDWFPLSFLIRGDARLDLTAAIRKAVTSADPAIPVTHITTMQSLIDHSVAGPRFFTQITQGFAAFSVLLTAIGLFGLLNYQVTQRTREIGVRMALGASRGRVLRNIMTSSIVLAAWGAALGSIGAFLLRPALTHWFAFSVVGLQTEQQKLLFGGGASIGIGVAVIAITALAASFIPARRAAHIDPMDAMRTE